MESITRAEHYCILSPGSKSFYKERTLKKVIERAYPLRVAERQKNLSEHSKYIKYNITLLKISLFIRFGWRATVFFYDIILSNP